VHGLQSFLFSSVIVAFTVNIAAGLMDSSHYDRVATRSNAPATSNKSINRAT
jgi:hypothetical protein